jgi:hypothetical protein
MEKANKRKSKLTPPKKRLSSDDFLKSAQKLWRAGPEVKYKNPDAWRRNIDQPLDEDRRQLAR